MKKGVKTIFSEVSPTYELVNHIMTFGLDIFWRKVAAREANKADGSLWLDACSGSGEMAWDLSCLAQEKVRIVAVDFCQKMLLKACSRVKGRKISLVLSEADKLPFADRTFDLVTISFATRNINDRREVLTRHFREFLRVLKPGGLFVNLETSQPPQIIIRKLFHLYVRLFVRPIGYFFSGSKAGYKYLASTIPRFYSAEELSAIIRLAGFASVSFRPLFLGVSAIHTAIK